MTDAAVQSLLDEDAIKRLHLRYCRGVDRMDWDLIRSCYHPDAVDDHGEYVGGIDGFIAYAKANLPSFASTNHCVCNQLVEVRGDTAFAEHYAIAYHRLPPEGGEPERDWIANVRYVDRLERRNGEWRIAHRRSIVDADRVEVVRQGLVPPDQMRGSRDRSDPSYER
ncbi:nuclear transport factor 2 family protein [Novosphingobium sp. M1R2S20]|uniref:Nuclear transport factor 2 family protein n=1 Tax=Novosphingobium rhizovicinum TaxID=3228928 RepID=A0ABV3REF9_9SPHN